MGTSPVGLAAGEFSGTTGLDLAAANEGNTITLLDNLGTGVFVRGGSIEVAERYTATAIATARFNTDNLDDFAISADDLESSPEFNGAVVVYRSTQALRFTATAVTVGVLPNCLQLGDLTGEGITDLATCDSAENGDGQISLVRGISGGGFSPAQGIGLDDVAPANMTAGNIDLDARRDLVVLDTDDNAVYLMYGFSANPVFTDPVQLAPFDTPVDAVIDFFNNDNLPDIAVASRDSGQVQVFLQQSPRTFVPAAPFGLGFFPAAIASGDFNNDGDIDLVSANNGSSDVTLVYGNGDGTFRAGESVPVGAGPVGIVAADFNDDDKLDFATVNQDDDRFGANTQSISVVLNGVTPPFTPTPTPSSTRTPTSTGTITGTATITRTPRRSFTPTRTRTPGPSPTPAGPADTNCDGFIDERDVYTVVTGIFAPGAGCLTQAVSAASVIEEIGLIATP